MKDIRFWPFVAPAIATAMFSLHEALDMSPPVALHYGNAFTGASIVAILVASAIWITRNNRRAPAIWLSLTFFVIAGLLSCVGVPLGFVSSSFILSMLAFACFAGSFYTFLRIQ